jgi:hypothetical protein
LKAGQHRLWKKRKKSFSNRLFHFILKFVLSSILLTHQISVVIPVLYPYQFYMKKYCCLSDVSGLFFLSRIPARKSEKKYLQLNAPFLFFTVQEAFRNDNPTKCMLITHKNPEEMMLSLSLQWIPKLFILPVS